MYLAGFFDGEGSVGLYWVTARKVFQARIHICQNYSPFMDLWFKRWAEVFEGGVSVTEKNGVLVSEMYIYRKAPILRFIESIIGLTKLKTRQLLVLKNYLETNQYGYRTSQLLKAQKHGN